MKTSQATHSNSVEMEPIYNLESVLPPVVYDFVIASEVSKIYHNTIETKVTDSRIYCKAENEYRTLLMSILSDGRFRTHYIN